MSLPALALLICATGALRESVEAAGASEWVRIDMAPHEPQATAEALGETILVAVFTGDEVHQLKARRWFDGDRRVELVIQALLPPAITATFEGASADLDSHKAGAEAVFATVARLFELAFAAPAPGTWGALFQKLITTHPGELQKMPFLATTKNGVDLLAVDWSIPCHLINSPVPGDPEVFAKGFWFDLVTKMRGDAKVAGLADLVAALIKGRLLPTWRIEQALAGVNVVSGAAVGVGALAGVEATPDGTAWTIETGRGTPLVVEVAP